MTPVAANVNLALLRDWPLPALDEDEGKEDRGRVLVVAGSRQLPGAAVLAGQAALRAGAGKLQLATAAGVGVAIGVAVPEAKVYELPTDARGQIRAANGELRRDARQADALVVGPGLDDTAASHRLGSTLLSCATGTVVLDAGALGAIHGGTRPRLPPVLTPHAGEMAALSRRTIDAVRRDPARLAVEFAVRNGVLMVLKGATTFIASPEGRLWRHEGGTVGLGTSGSGDVLAGLIAGIAARGAGGEQAAVWGVFLHGSAGERLSAKVGQVGFLASEIAAEVPALLDQIPGRGRFAPSCPSPVGRSSQSA